MGILPLKMACNNLHCVIENDPVYLNAFNIGGKAMKDFAHFSETGTDTSINRRYEIWISKNEYELKPDNTYFSLDADGINNGVEYYMGTNPSRGDSSGMNQVLVFDDQLSFKHTISPNASGIKPIYQWSENLEIFHNDGIADALGLSW